jgi:hypothetical protein
VAENRIAAGVIADPRETRAIAAALIEGVERVLAVSGPGENVEVCEALESVITATYQLGTRLTVREAAVELVKRGRPASARKAKARLDRGPERWLERALLEQEAAGVVLKKGEKLAGALQPELQAKASPFLDELGREEGWPSISSIKRQIAKIKDSRVTL